MLKKLLAFFATMFIFAAFAAVDVNKATEAELDGLKGIGPVTTRLIVAERKKAEFKSWDDFITRVKGVGEKSAAKFSAEGLTVSGASYAGPAAKETKASTKADASKTSKPATEKSKDAAVTTKDAVKGAAVGTKDATKETAKDTKAAVAPKSDTAKAKNDEKADAAKPAASAVKK
jgi:competence protein ComEA